MLSWMQKFVKILLTFDKNLTKNLPGHDTARWRPEALNYRRQQELARGTPWWNVRGTSRCWFARPGTWPCQPGPEPQQPRSTPWIFVNFLSNFVKILSNFSKIFANFYQTLFIIVLKFQQISRFFSNFRLILLQFQWKIFRISYHFDE